jgi:NAD(P)-dependent dehydrogenase (short-subunit alcohol dehydrogenase family)
MYREQGLRCNAVLPGGLATQFFQNSAAKLDPEGWPALLPYVSCQPRILASADAVASAVMYLVGPGANSVNGAELTVDGGWLAS